MKFILWHDVDDSDEGVREDDEDQYSDEEEEEEGVEVEDVEGLVVA